MSIFGDVYYGIRNSQAVTRFLDEEEVKERARQSLIYVEEKDGKKYAVELSKAELKAEYDKIEEDLKKARIQAEEKGILIDDDTYEATEKMMKHQFRERLIEREVAKKERHYEMAKSVAENHKEYEEYYTGDISGPGKEALPKDVKGDKTALREFEKEQAILKNAGRDFGGGIRKIKHKEYDTVRVGNQEWVKLRESMNHKQDGVSKGRYAEDERLPSDRENVRMMPREEEKTEKALSIKKQMESAKNEQAKEKATNQREAGKKKLMSEYKNPDGKDAVRNQAKTQSKESSFQNFFNSFRERCKQTRFYQKVIEKSQEKEAERVKVM